MESVIFYFYCVFLPTMLVNISIMSSSIHMLHWLPNIHDPILLTLSFMIGWCRCHALCCLKKLPLLPRWIIATHCHFHYPKCLKIIINTPFPLIFKMGQGVCCFCLCPKWMEVPHFRMSASSHHIDYPICKAKTHWHFIDVHFQNGAVTMALSLLALKATDMLFMHNSNQITFQLHYLQDQKSLILHWYSF